MFCELILFNIFLSIFVGPQDFDMAQNISSDFIIFLLLLYTCRYKNKHVLIFLLELFAIETNVKQDCNISCS